MSLTKQHATLIARAVLTFAFVAGYGFILLKIIAVMSLEITVSMKEILLYLLGALTQSVGQVIAFWFSSSQGSADKDHRSNP